MDDVPRPQPVGMALLLTANGVQLLGEGITPWLWAAVVAAASTGGMLAWRWRLRELWVASSPGESISNAVRTAAPVVVGLGFVGGLWLAFSYTVLFNTFAAGLFAGYLVEFAAEWIDLRGRVQTVTGA